MRKSQEFFIVFSPRAGVLQFCELCKLGLTWMFLLIFWGKGLLCWFSGVVSLAVLHCPCQGGRAVSYAPDYSMWLLFPEGFPHHFRGWEWKCEPPSVQPWSWILAPSVPSRRSCQTLLSPWFLSALCVHTACDWAFLSQPCHPLWSFQTLLPPVACIHTAPPGGGREVLTWFCHLLGHHSESSHPTHGSSWFMATPSWKPPSPLTGCSQLPCSDAWELSHTQTAMFFLWFRGSWAQAVPPRIPPCFSTWVPFTQGCPSPEQTSKSSNLHVTAVSLSESWLMDAPSPYGLSSHISPRIRISAPPTLQKAVAFLSVELQQFFS